VKLMLEKGANSESRDYQGWTPLKLAAQNGNETVLKLLSKNGAANLRSKDKYGSTPLYQ
jgi:ankyrin repeat protein